MKTRALLSYSPVPGSYGRTARTLRRAAALAASLTCIVSLALGPRAASAAAPEESPAEPTPTAEESAAPPSAEEGPPTTEGAETREFVDESSTPAAADAGRAETGTANPGPEPAVAAPVPPVVPAPPPVAVPSGARDDDPETAELRLAVSKGTRLTKAGAITGGIGLGAGLIFVGGALILAANAQRRADTDDYATEFQLADFEGRVRRRKKFAIGAGVITAPAVIVGAVLLGVGLTRTKRARERLEIRNAELRSKPSAMLVPTAGREGGGLAVAGRF